MSCLAKERYVVYVTGILEKAICEDALNCREDGVKIFSTTVVFGKNGQIIAKYVCPFLFHAIWLSNKFASDIENSTWWTSLL
jgi:hypothetical protein